jgi:3-isopropylmalate dehydrogenase
MILSVAMLVRWMGDKRGDPALQRTGDAMTAAVDRTLENPATRTRDVGGQLGTRDFAAAVAAAV